MAEDTQGNDNTGGDYSHQITLCIFPHLSNLIAIDMRLENARIMEINVKDVLSQSFTTDLVDNFASLLNSSEPVIADIANIPQQVESTIKYGLFKRVIELIDDDETLESGRISILFFTGEILWINSNKWREALQKMFQDHFSDEQLDDLFENLESMVSEERRLQGGAKVNLLNDLISGTHDGFVTMWKRESS